MPFDPLLFATGFIVGAASVAMLGASLAKEHGKRYIVPATVVSALLCGGIVGWSLNYFFHFAQRTGP
jgi:membrane protein YqaA with SNARE-associated domain